MAKKKNKTKKTLPCEWSFLARFLLFLLGIAFFPISVALVRTLILLSKIMPGDRVFGLPASVAAFTLGFFVYCITFIAFKHPTKVYVVVHELTHALFGLCHGARPSNLEIDDERGSIKLSHTTLLTTLAPYFFPLPVVAILLAVGGFSLFVPGVNTYGAYVMPFVGAAWGFHFCFTVNALLQWQSDVESCGFFFSYSLILLLNLVALCLLLVAMSPATFSLTLSVFWDMLKHIVFWLMYEAFR